MKYEKPKVINLSSRAALGESSVPDACTSGGSAGCAVGGSVSGGPQLCQTGTSALAGCMSGNSAGAGSCLSGTGGTPDPTCSTGTSAAP